MRTRCSVGNAVMLCVLFVAALPACAQDGGQHGRAPATSYPDAVEKGLAAAHAGALADAEAYYRQGIEMGPPDADARAWIFGATSEILRREYKGEESLPFAREAWSLVRSPGNLYLLVEAAVAAGDLELAGEALDLAEASRAQLGDYTGPLTEWRSRLSTQVYRIVYRIPGDRWPERRTVVLYPPIAETRYQKVLQQTVEGAASWSQKTDGLGTPYLELVRSPGQEIRLTVEIEQHPVDHRREFANYQPGPLPDDVKQYLGRSVGQDPLAVVDPDGPLARQIASDLQGKDELETATNVMRWCCTNLLNPYTPDLRNCEPSEVILSKRRGHCEHYATAFMALMRASGIPARMVRGHSCVFSTTVGKVDYPLQHSSTEFYLNGIGWIEFRSASSPWLVCPGFVGRAYARVPSDPNGLSGPGDIADGVEAIGPVVDGKPTYKGEHLHCFELLRQSPWPDGR